MRLIDADELMEHIWRDKLDSRELIAKMINNAPTVTEEFIAKSVLNKIRAEIDNALSDGMIHKKTVLGIIDKYKAESED